MTLEKHEVVREDNGAVLQAAYVRAGETTSFVTSEPIIGRWFWRLSCPVPERPVPEPEPEYEGPFAKTRKLLAEGVDAIEYDRVAFESERRQLEVEVAEALLELAQAEARLEASGG